MNKQILNYLTTPIKAAPLAVFRVIFGLLMLYTTLRFVGQGWVEKYYIVPQFHFKYYGFEFVESLGVYTYLLYLISFLAAIGVTIGYKYRLSILIFFLSFTYCELIDKTYYLNHYYFVSIISFLLIFLPANAYFSIDAFQNKKIAFHKIPRYNIFVIQFMLSIVYFYAGLAKINSEWLFNAMPLKIWLPSRYDLPVLGQLFQLEWVHYVMSWSGMLYDLLIPFLLFNKRTRTFAFVLVVVFHVMTRVLFPIGIFPYVMICATLIFFDASFHEKIITFIRKSFNLKNTQEQAVLEWKPSFRKKTLAVFFIVFFSFQLVFPFRYLLYSDELFWTEEGYRYSWRVMLMEKGGYVQFKVVNPTTDKWFYVENQNFLTEYQQKQMRIQADLILEFAHYLEDYYQEKGISNPEIYVDSFIALNGRTSKRYIDPNVDLTKVKDTWQHKNWILPFNEKIYGF
ncbi:HTTM domain-containing protein [Psychroflexus salis]|uniref:Type I deoxyribonuclease HsdR n=1 Tax=Psychroflexus salis TaxID=1526574 RepID=A0A916ZW74_9FLAO|nr:HTTM domain-containing protein [Psychroflexus salis]GGE15975.1 type I deoxyribonuclease HsdR [Psychroflexus salis]